MAYLGRIAEQCHCGDGGFPADLTGDISYGYQFQKYTGTDLQLVLLNT